jgi:hypothetical protein
VGGAFCHRFLCFHTISAPSAAKPPVLCHFALLQALKSSWRCPQATTTPNCRPISPKAHYHHHHPGRAGTNDLHPYCLLAALVTSRRAPRRCRSRRRSFAHASSPRTGHRPPHSFSPSLLTLATVTPHECAIHYVTTFLSSPFSRPRGISSRLAPAGSCTPNDLVLRF